MVEPERVVMAAAQQAGQVSPEQVAIITEAFDDIHRVKSDPEVLVLALVEAELTKSAIGFGPRELRRTAASMVYVHDQDGREPDDARCDHTVTFDQRAATLSQMRLLVAP